MKKLNKHKKERWNAITVKASSNTLKSEHNKGKKQNIYCRPFHGSSIPEKLSTPSS